MKESYATAKLKLDNEVGLANTLEGHLDYSLAGVHANAAIGKALQTALEIIHGPRTFPRHNGVRGPNLRKPSSKAFEVGGLEQLAIESRRTDFQNVSRARNQFFHVQNDTQLLADGLTIAVADTFRLVNKNAKQALLANFPLEVDNFEPQRMRDAIGRSTNSIEFHMDTEETPPSRGKLISTTLAGALLSQEILCQQKSGLAPTRSFDPLPSRFAIIAG